MRRRSFIQTSVLTGSALVAQESRPASVPAGSPRKLAAVVPDYRLRSSADNLVTRFLEGYWLNDDFHRPACTIASLCVLQIETGDIGQRISTAYRVPIARSIGDALTLGTGSLAVDGVLLLGGSDEFPRQNAKGGLDSRFESFEQIVSVFRKSGRSVPVFCGGYLSTDWGQARRMYQQSRDAGFLLMAGTSEAATFRRPELDYPLTAGFDDAPLGDRARPRYPLGVEFDDALVITSDGSRASGIFSGLEILQSFLERRRGGESGIDSFEYLTGNAVWRAAEEDRWSKDLMKTALGRAERLGRGRPEDVEHPAVCLLHHNDGTRGAVLSLGGLVRESLAAFRIKGRREIDSTLCYMPIESRNDFSMLVHGISLMMNEGRCPYPAERNLLTSGALSFLRESALHGKQIETPMLKVAYTAPEHSFYAHGRGW